MSSVAAEERDEPRVKVGDKLTVWLADERTGAEQKKKAVVAAVQRSKKERMGSRWKYSLRLSLDEGDDSKEGETLLETRLLDLRWKLRSGGNKRSREETERETASAAVSECVTITKKDKKEKAEKALKVPKPMKRVKAAISFPLSALRHIVAPMVGASELTFRLLCRRYGATLAYTPMISSERFAVDAEYRAQEFQCTPEDRPVVAHFSANDPQVFLAAAKQVEAHCDAIDLNLGCPQRVAHSGRFGSFLLGEEDRPLVLSLVRAIAENCTVPIFVKIRLLDTIEDTIRLCKQLEVAGAALIAIHGRYRVNLVGRTGPGARDGAAHLDQIKAVREVVQSIPIIANGNVRCWEDVQSNLDFTGAAGIMSAEGLLDDPALFNGGTAVDKLQLGLEYIELVERHPVKMKSVVFHIRRMCKDLLTQYQMMEDCVEAQSVAEVKNILQNIAQFRKTGNFLFDPLKAKKEKEAIERRKREEGKRKDFEARMMRKAKREGKDPSFYLMQGAEPPTTEILDDLRAMAHADAFEIWKKNHGQHCWAFHFDKDGCKRDRTCSFLHHDPKMSEPVAFG